MEIAALVSGGVDSSVVVHQLKEAGYDPTIFYIRIGMEDKDGYIDCPAEEDIEITSYIAKKYGCRFEIVSLHDEYWDRVVSYTIDSVKRGLTPNPDMMCNKYIKFGCFEEKWGKDFDKIATGHYATTTEIDGKVWLSTAKDPVKDQTDFLGQITRLQIQKLMFPIGHLMKSEVRAIAEQQKLPSAKRKDSQGICFLGKINYNDFIERYLGKRTGKIVELETGKVLGKHNGYWFHTIGQRKGLGIGGRRESLFILATDTVQNVIWVGEGDAHPGLWRPALHIAPGEIHWVNPARELTAGQSARFSVRIRYRQPLQGARLFVRDEGAYLVFDRPQRGITPGQFAAWYDGDQLVGSGVIEG